MRRRYFRYYMDDTLQPLGGFRGASMIGAKPFIFHLQKSRAKRKTALDAVSVRMGNQFMKKLDRLGL